WIGRDLEREVGIEALLVLFRDEFLCGDVEPDVLPEGERGGRTRLHAGRLELSRVHELSGGGGGRLRLRSTDLGGHAPHRRKPPPRRGGESEVEQPPPRHARAAAAG